MTHDAEKGERYVVGYYCPKGEGHFDLYSDPDAEMACGSHLVPIYLDIQSGEDFGGRGLPEGQWVTSCH